MRDCGLSFAVFWGWHDPAALSTSCAPPLNPLHCALPPTSCAAAPPSLPCSPPSSCLDYFLLSQASPHHRDRLRSLDDGDMRSCGRSPCTLTKDAGASSFAVSLFHLGLRAVRESTAWRHFAHLLQHLDSSAELLGHPGHVRVRRVVVG